MNWCLRVFFLGMFFAVLERQSQAVFSKVAENQVNFLLSRGEIGHRVVDCFVVHRKKKTRGGASMYLTNFISLPFTHGTAIQVCLVSFPLDWLLHSLNLSFHENHNPVTSK